MKLIIHSKECCCDFKDNILQIVCCFYLLAIFANFLAWISNLYFPAVSCIKNKIFTICNIVHDHYTTRPQLDFTVYFINCILQNAVDIVDDDESKSDKLHELTKTVSKDKKGKKEKDRKSPTKSKIQLQAPTPGTLLIKGQPLLIKGQPSGLPRMGLIGATRGWAQLCSQGQFGRQLTINLELVQTRGIRFIYYVSCVSNKRSSAKYRIEIANKFSNVDDLMWYFIYYSTS